MQHTVVFMNGLEIKAFYVDYQSLITLEGIYGCMVKTVDGKNPWQPLKTF